MKLNKVLTAACSLLISTSVFAGNSHLMPRLPNADKPVEHGVQKPQLIDERAPIARLEFNDDGHSHAHSDHAHHKPKRLAKAAVACNVSAFGTSNSSTLINEIKTQGSTCVNELFGASSNTQYYAFSSDNMYAVANHTAGIARNYAGNGDADLEALYLYLRAGYFAEYYNDSITFISWVKPAVKSAIDAFVNNSNFYNNNDGHGKVLQEVIIAMDSTEQQDVYLPVVKEWLSRWNQSYGANWNMRSAVNGIFTLLFRGQWNPNFVSLIGNDTTLVSRLRSFTMSSWMINSDSEYLIANAAGELGRLKMYSGTAIQTSVDAGLNDIFSSYQMYGTGDAVWLGAANTAEFYGNCADYGICGYRAQVEAQVLSQIHVCSPTIKIRAQSLTSTQQASACSSMGGQETYFHSKLQTGNTPIPGDNNTQLQVNVFNSDLDYQKYAAAIFEIPTNNGGMYLEGNPSDPNNVPNFVAYEASYANPDHYVWNLEHEYIHYLDGRFNLAGDFNAPTAPVVWWAEGLAEYISLKDNNQAAYDTINDGSTYGLSTIFATTYDGFDQDRIYRWGYLAVRFMFERHSNEVQAMRSEIRAGNWSAYQSRVNTWANSYSSEFTNWLQTVTPGSSNPDLYAPVAVANGPYTVELGSALTFSSSGSYDSDGNIVSYAWDFGDGQTSNQANPNHTYASAGDYTATLTVTDDSNLSASSSALVRVSDPIQGGLQLSNGQTKTGLSASTGQTSATYYINVPSGATNLNISISGGSGDGDLYVRALSAPDTSTFDCRPYLTGNAETCTISAPQAGSWYMNVYAYDAFAGLNLTVSYDTATQNVVPVANIDGPYNVEVNQVVSMSSSGSYDTDGSITDYLWSFGDGQTSTLANPQHTYSVAGTYTVTLTVTDNMNATGQVSTTATVSDVTNPGGGLADMCAIQGAQTGGEVSDGQAICLGTTNTSWFHIGDVNGSSSMSITTAHGTGNLDIEFSNMSWPNGSNVQGASYNSGNSECIYLTNLSEYWGYIKVSGTSSGASLVVDLDSQGCR